MWFIFNVACLFPLSHSGRQERTRFQRRSERFWLSLPVNASETHVGQMPRATDAVWNFAARDFVRRCSHTGRGVKTDVWQWPMLWTRLHTALFYLFAFNFNIFSDTWELRGSATALFGLFGALLVHKSEFIGLQWVGEALTIQKTWGLRARDGKGLPRRRGRRQKTMP